MPSERSTPDQQKTEQLKLEKTMRAAIKEFDKWFGTLDDALRAEVQEWLDDNSNLLVIDDAAIGPAVWALHQHNLDYLRLWRLGSDAPAVYLLSCCGVTCQGEGNNPLGIRLESVFGLIFQVVDITSNRKLHLHLTDPESGLDVDADLVFARSFG